MIPVQEAMLTSPPAIIQEAVKGAVSGLILLGKNGSDGCVNYAYTMSWPPVAYEGTAEADQLNKSCQGPNIPEKAYFKYSKQSDGGYYADVYCSSGRYYDSRRGGCVTPEYQRMRR